MALPALQAVVRHALHCLLVWELPAKALRPPPHRSASAPTPAAALLELTVSRLSLQNGWSSASVPRHAGYLLVELLEQLHSSCCAPGSGVDVPELEPQLLQLAPQLWRLAAGAPPPVSGGSLDVTAIHLEIQQHVRAGLLLLQQLVSPQGAAQLAAQLFSELSATASAPAGRATTPPPRSAAGEQANQPLMAQLAALIGSATPMDARGAAGTPLRSMQLTTPGKGGATPTTPGAAPAAGTPPGRSVAANTPSPGLQARGGQQQLYAVELACSGIRTWGVLVRLLGKRAFTKPVGQQLLDVSGGCSLCVCGGGGGACEHLPHHCRAIVVVCIML